jgi:hypothetical protein
MALCLHEGAENTWKTLSDEKNNKRYIYTAALFYTLRVEYYSTPQAKTDLKKY